MTPALRVLLHPLATALHLLVLYFATQHLPFVASCFIVILYAVVTLSVPIPAKRRVGAWARLFDPQTAAKVAAEDRGCLRPKSAPVVILSCATPIESRWQHVAAYNEASFENATVLSMGPALTARHPAARVCLALLGGVMQYARPALLQLLRRPTSAVIVTLPSAVSTPPGGSLRVHLRNKGVFSAVLRSGAALVPSVVFADGSVVVGKVLPTTGGGTAAGIAVPTPEQVVVLTKEYATALQALYSRNAASKGAKEALLVIV